MTHFTKALGCSKRVLIALALLPLLSCESGDSSTAPSMLPEPGPATYAISDGSRPGGNPLFHFRHPLSKASYTLQRPFAAELFPVLSVEVCVWNGTVCVGAPLVRFTSQGDASSRLAMDIAGKVFSATWQTAPGAVDPTRIYRVSVKAGSVELGFADVDVWSDQKEFPAIDQNEYVPLQLGTALPIVFAVEEGAVTVDLPPVITITSPARAAMLQQGTMDESPVTISGQACHPHSPITELTVAGTLVPVSGTQRCESFSVEQESAWGLSIIEADAEAANGASTRAVQSFLRSPTFTEPAFMVEEAARVPRGVYAQLNQPVIDDLNRADLDDVASFLQRILNELDGSDFIAGSRVLFSDPLRGGCAFPEVWADYSYIVRTTGPLELGSRHVLNTWVSGDPGRFDASARLESPYLPFFVSAQLRECTLGIETTQSASANGFTRAARVDGSGRYFVGMFAENVHVNAMAPVINTSGLALDLEFPPLFDFVLDAAVDLVLPFFENAIEDVLADVMADEFARVLEELLENFRVDASSSINGANVSIDAELDHLNLGGTFGNGFVQLGLAPQSLPIGAPRFPDAPFGGISARGPLPTFSPFGYTIGAALADDFANQLLWSAWQGGAFDVEDALALAGGAYPGVLAASASALLPPVVGPGEGPADLSVGWGDFEITASVDPTSLGLPPGVAVPVQVYGSANITLGLVFDNATSRLRTTDLVPEVHVSSVEVWGEAAGVEAQLETMLEDLIGNLLPAAVAAVPMPKLSLGGVTLELHNATVSRQGRYITLTGTVRN